MILALCRRNRFSSEAKSSKTRLVLALNKQNRNPTSTTHDGCGAAVEGDLRVRKSVPIKRPRPLLPTVDCRVPERVRGKQSGTADSKTNIRIINVEEWVLQNEPTEGKMVYKWNLHFCGLSGS